MNVLVTGGAGYVGAALIQELVANPTINQVVIYDNLIRNNHNIFLGKPSLNCSKIQFVRGDILDSRKLKKEVDKADVVYHLAAKVTTPFADHSPHEFDQINNWGTAELAYLIEESNVSKFIYASSVAVYGASSENIDINADLNPKTFYGISKYHGEAHIKRLNKPNLNVYILRMGNVYGFNESMRFDSVINKFAFEAKFSNRIQIIGAGDQIRSFIHINRLSKLLTDFSINSFKSDTYNLVENTYSINEIVDGLKLFYPKLETIFVNQNVVMRSLIVSSDSRLMTSNSNKELVLRNDLLSLKENFSF